MTENGTPITGASTARVLEKKQVVVLSGMKPTIQLYDSMLKQFDSIAVYDQNAAMHISGARGESVACPVTGAGESLYARARNNAALLTGQIVETLPKISFSVDGTGPLPLRDWLPGLALGILPDVLINLHSLTAFHESDEYDVVGVVTHEDVTPKFRSLALWSKARGIPTIHVPHGNCFNLSRPDIHDESVCDWILASSSYMRDWYAERGFPKHRIKITGFPDWDGWVKQNVTQENARKILQLPADKPTVLFGMAWAQRTNLVDDHDALEVASHIALAAAKKAGWQLIWSLHPGCQQDQEQRCLRLAAAHRVDAMVTRDHLPLTLAASDAVLYVGPSNMVVEAALNNRPAAIFELRGYGFPGEPPWRAEYNIDQTIDVMNGLMHDELPPWRDQFIKRYAYRNDGKATARTVRQIKRIIRAGEVQVSRV